MIRIMPPHLANQIAAGEVVERPASVIKECVENSFDAAATSVDVVLEAAGSQFISIKDNGVGIDKDELELAVCRHATSKISSIDDLEHLATMGFRGEALASIASVAQLRLSSRIGSSDIGYCLQVMQDSMEKLTCAMSYGTKIEIENLFYNTPARRRFMRTERTELNHIEDVFKRLALSNPIVKMTLMHNDKLLRDYPSGLSYLDQNERLKAIMGSDWVKNSVLVNAVSDKIKLYGYIASPPMLRSQPDSQYLFVNSRSIKDSGFAHAVKRAMQDLLYADKYPMWVMYLEIDPSYIDVNIHPSKDRVRFSDASWVYDWVYKTIRSLFHVAPSYDFMRTKAALESRPSIQPIQKMPDLWTAFSEVAPVSEKAAPRIEYEKTISNSNIKVEATVNNIQAFCQINQAYLLGRYNNEIWIIDIHAAHERKLMEDLVLKLNTLGLEKENLLLPLDAECQNIDSNALDILSKYGFLLQKEESWKIYSIPRGLNIAWAVKIFNRIISCLDHDLTIVEAGSMAYDLIADIACHSAVNASREMTKIELQYFIENLSNIPEVCNHGRPWKWRITSNDLDKYFMRGK